MRSLVQCDQQKFIAEQLDAQLAARLMADDEPDLPASIPVADTEDIIIEKLKDRKSLYYAVIHGNHDFCTP